MKLILIIFAPFFVFTSSAQSDEALSLEDNVKTSIETKVKSGDYDLMEGIWTVTKVIKTYANGKLSQDSGPGEEFPQAVIKSGNEFRVYNINKGFTGLTFQSDMNRSYEATQEIKDGFLYGTVSIINSQNLKVTLNMGDKNYKEYGIRIRMVSEMTFRKIYPSFSEIESIRKKAINDLPLSGTGFAISSNGMIVTNYHVIENAKSIKIKGLNGVFDKSFDAQVMQTDKVNDLAIIKIKDPDFNNLGTIPFQIKTSTSEVGEDIFVLGFPLTATMGEEVKLTTGVVSSKTGFQGNVTQYQISAPIQPGNSGGPLFDKSGNVIGIISAKHLNTENVGYAIKASYLQSLIDLLPEKISIPNLLLVTNKSLSVQVKAVKNFIYIIEVNNK